MQLGYSGDKEGSSYLYSSISKDHGRRSGPFLGSSRSSKGNGMEPHLARMLKNIDSDLIARSPLKGDSVGQRCLMRS